MPDKRDRAARQPRLCVLCGSLIVGRSVPVWMAPVVEPDVPEVPVRWGRAHLDCAALVDNAGQEEDSQRLV